MKKKKHFSLLLHPSALFHLPHPLLLLPLYIYTYIYINVETGSFSFFFFSINEFQSECFTDYIWCGVIIVFFLSPCLCVAIFLPRLAPLSKKTIRRSIFFFFLNFFFLNMRVSVFLFFIPQFFSWHIVCNWFLFFIIFLPRSLSYFFLHYSNYSSIFFFPLLFCRVSNFFFLEGRFLFIDIIRDGVSLYLLIFSN